MRVAVESIPEEGLTLDIEGGEPWALEATARAVEGAVRGLSGHLRITRLGDEVRVRGQLSAEIRRACDRCDDEIIGPVGGEVDLAYVPVGRLASGVHDLKADELDLGFYDAGALELSAVVQEHFALSLPMRLSCDAPGYAPANGLPCTWEPPFSPEEDEVVDPRFAALAGFKPDN